MSLRSLLSVFSRKSPVKQATAPSPGLSSAAANAVSPPEVYTTSRCKAHGHPEFQIRVSANSAIPAPDIVWFLGYMEKRVARGDTFRAGESFQIGWMFTMLANGPEGFLKVLEPDMQAVPVQFTDSMDATLMHLRNQRDVVASCTRQLDPEFPSLRQSAVVHVDYKTARRVLLTRTAAVDNADSGWWLTDLDDEAGAQDASRFSKIPLYQLGVDRPDLIKFFAVPAELQVVVDVDHIGLLDGEGELKQVPGSYLSELNRARQQRA